MGRDQLSDRMADVGAPLGNVDSTSIHRTLWKDAQDVVYRAEAVYNLLMRMETAQAINRLGWQSVRNCFMDVLRGTVQVTAAEERLDVKAHTMGLAEALQRASAEDSKVAVTGSPIRYASPTDASDASDAASEPLTLWLTIDLLDEGWVEFRNPTDKNAQMVGMNRQTWQSLGCPARIQAVVTEQPKEGTR